MKRPGIHDHPARLAPEPIQRRQGCRPGTSRAANGDAPTVRAAKALSRLLGVGAMLAALPPTGVFADPPAEPLSPWTFVRDDALVDPLPGTRTWVVLSREGAGQEVAVFPQCGPPAFEVTMDPWKFTQRVTTTNPFGFEVKLDMNDDGVWDVEKTLTTESPWPRVVTATWNYPQPLPFDVGRHTIRWDVREIPQSGAREFVASGFTPISVVLDKKVAYRATNGDGSTLVGFLSADGILDRPLVLVEGFDASNRTFAPDIVAQSSSALRGMSPSAGYDVFVYNFGNAREDIRYNAMGLLGALMRLNEDVAFETRVVGLSLGGVAARYALAWAEGEGVDHHCDLFVSFDAPQQGAWANTGLQNFVKDQDHNPSVAGIVATINSTAAKQLLRHNVYDDPPNPEHTSEIAGGPVYMEFFNDLNGLNDGHGYPRITHNIGMSNAQGDLEEQHIRSAQAESFVNWPMLKMSIQGSPGFGTVYYSILDLIAGSLQPVYRGAEPIEEEVTVYELSFFGLFNLVVVSVDVTLTFTTEAAGNFIWANSALDLWDVEWGTDPTSTTGDIVGWNDDLKFDEIHVAQGRTYFHDDIPPGHKVVLIDALDAAGLQYPKGGETLLVDSDVEVRWFNPMEHDYTSHDLLFSSDGGASFAVLASGISGDSESATVRMPTVSPSDACRLAVESNREGAVDRSESENFALTVGFSDVTSSVLAGGLLEGVAWGDINGDGNLDMCRLVVESNGSAEFFVGDGLGGFIYRHDLSQSAVKPRSAAFADFDNDGRLDVYIGCDGPNLLLKNFPGVHPNYDVRLENVALSPVDDAGRARGVSWGDYNRDGRIDLFVANADSPNELFRNDGNGLWSDVSAGVGGLASDDTHGGVWGDYDGDGDADLFVVNSGADDQLYMNNGAGALIPQTLPQTDDVESRSADWVDYDNDLDLDLFVVKAFGTDVLYENQGNGTFLEVDRGLGGTSGIGDYACTWRDVANSGWQDPYVVSALEDRSYTNLGFQGTSNFRFDGDGPHGNGLHGQGFGRVGVSADFDNDGRMDMYVADIEDAQLTNRLLRNNVVSEGFNWLEIELEGTTVNKSAIGAQIEVHTPRPGGGQFTMLREVTSGSGYQSAEPLRKHVGIGTATSATVKVHWSGGIVSIHEVNTVNEIVNIVQPPPPAGGGGGGCPYLFVHDGDDFRITNTLLAPVPADAAGKIESNVHDTYVVQVDPAVVDGFHEMEIREFEQEYSYFDSVELLAIRHPEGSSLVVTNDGAFALRSEEVTRPFSATNAHGADVTDLVTDGVDTFFSGKPGDVMTVLFDAADIDLDDPILVEGSAKPWEHLPVGSVSTDEVAEGIEVLVRVADEFVSLGAVVPRELPSASYVDVLRLNVLEQQVDEEVVELRLVWHTRHDLHQIGWTRSISAEFEIEAERLVRAEHVAVEGFGTPVDVLGDLAEADGRFAELEPGERISLAFEAAGDPEAGRRTYVLAIDGHYSRITVAAAEETHAGFHLFGAAPNPFNPRTTIGFTLPAPTALSLRVYGPDGRLVRSLLDGQLAAGPHDVAWDGRDDAGRVLSSGVYFYRLETPAREETRRMTILK